MSNSQPETRGFHLAAATASAAATGYAQTDYAQNGYLLIDLIAAGGGTVTVGLSSGSATGAAGTAVTSVGVTTTGLSFYRLPPSKLGKYAYASCSGSAGQPIYTATLLLTDFPSSEAGATGNRATNLF